MTDRVAELHAIINTAQQELIAMHDEKKRVLGAALVGKCYRYRNSFSCPEGDADYWWLYMKLTGLDDMGTLIAHTFQTDKTGKIEIRFDEPRYGFDPEGRFGTWEEISDIKFRSEWMVLQIEIAGRNP